MAEDIYGWDLADAIADPGSVFTHPSEVVQMQELFKRDKLAILNSWGQLEMQSSQSKDLDDGPGEPSLLAAVEAAIQEVG